MILASYHRIDGIKRGDIRQQGLAPYGMIIASTMLDVGLFLSWVLVALKSEEGIIK